MARWQVNEEITFHSEIVPTHEQLICFQLNGLSEMHWKMPIVYVLRPKQWSAFETRASQFTYRRIGRAVTKAYGNRVSFVPHTQRPTLHCKYSQTHARTHFTSHAWLDLRQMHKSQANQCCDNTRRITKMHASRQSLIKPKEILTLKRG